MKCRIFRNSWSRLLCAFTIVCGILLPGAAASIPGATMMAGPLDRRSGDLLGNGVTSARLPDLPGGLDAAVGGHDAKDDTEPQGTANGPVKKNIGDIFTQFLGRQSVALAKPAAAMAMPVMTPVGYAVPNDESHNMGLLANISRPGTNSDLAFWGTLAVAGNYEGFRIINIADPEYPTVLSTVACHGPQNDVSVWNNLVFLSVDRPQTATTCSQDAPNPNDPSAFEGIRVFDISNPTAPQLRDRRAHRLRLAHTHLDPRPRQQPLAPVRLVLLYIERAALRAGTRG